MNAAERRAPPDDRELAAVIAECDGLQRNVVRDARDLIGPRLRHPRVVVGIVGDVAGIMVALEPADSMLHLRRSRLHPRTCQCLRVAQERMEAFRIGAVLDREARQVGFFGNAPRLGGMRQVAVAQYHHRCHVLRGDANRFDRDVEAIRRRRWRQDGERRVGVAAEHRLKQIGLLGLGRHACRWAGALRVDDDERQLSGDSQSDHFGLQRNAWSGARRHAEGAGVGCPQRGPSGGNLILGLECYDAVGAQIGQCVQQRRCGGDRISREHELLDP